MQFYANMSQLCASPQFSPVLKCSFSPERAMKVRFWIAITASHDHEKLASETKRAKEMIKA